MKREIDDKARKLQALIRELGWQADLQSLIDRFNQVDNGVTQEDEFIYLLNWTGQCRFFHKLDQSIIPPSLAKHAYVIPDVLAELEYQGKSQLFLIEIKTSRGTKLDFTSAYYHGLMHYSKLLNIPILIAWKIVDYDVWTLVELQTFTKAVINYKLTAERAYQENIFPSLVGDYAIAPYDEFGFGMKLKKVNKVHEAGNSATWEMIVDDVYFIGKDYKRIDGSDNNIFKVLLAFHTYQKNQDTPEYIINEYLVEPNSMLFAQSVLLRLVKSASDMPINWIERIRDNRYPIKYSELRTSLQAAIDTQLIYMVLDIVPRETKI